MVDGEKIIPVVRQFYDSPSTGKMTQGDVRRVRQGEGGEQGDPLMPLLFSLGQHRAMVAVQAQLKEGERLFAFLDDIYVVCSPDRIGQIYLFLEEQLRVKTGISIQQGKTKLWNAAGCKRAMAGMLTVAAKRRSTGGVIKDSQSRNKE